MNNNLETSIKNIINVCENAKDVMNNLLNNNDYD